ncbi:MAG: ATP-binding cassette domain-containing protein [Planctomycetes bacterium]|nr:ATP-binding cassette domain-containing protein [Planctomycetota bacterium]
MIEFDNVTKRFSDQSGADVVAVRELALTIGRGETHALIGTSGCGKTTTLRMINRLEEPTSGSIRVDGQDIAAVDVYGLRRRIGYVIQTGGLFPHMTVAENIGVLCELERHPPAEISRRVGELLSLVGLEPTQFATRFPGELSGGQRQRVGVARALALDPDYVLMDEPFSALDPITRTEIHDEFEQVLKTVHKTVLLVTHDLHEAFKLADRISIMHGGSIVQTGTREQLERTPANEFVSRFLAGSDLS